MTTNTQNILDWKEEVTDSVARYNKLQNAVPKPPSEGDLALLHFVVQQVIADRLGLIAAQNDRLIEALTTRGNESN